MKTRISFLAVATSFAAFNFAPSIHAQPLVNVEMVTVGDAGNAADTTGYGAVADVFAIGKYEVTIAQYTTFLNGVASVTSDSYIVDLWNAKMVGDSFIGSLIGRSGSGTVLDPYVYSPIGDSNRPVAYVSWFDAARFANWMNNGATNGASTETGAYTLNGATTGIITKNAGATWWIPSEDEWYKAAYYKGGGSNAGYWLYPTRSDTAPTAQANPPGGSGSANYNNARPLGENMLTEIGAYITSEGPYGTFDQAGNVDEWNDGVVNGVNRGLRGGGWLASQFYISSSNRNGYVPEYEGFGTIGFRLAAAVSDGAALPRIFSTFHGTSGFSMTWTPASNVNVQRRLDLNGTAQWTTVLSNVTGTSYVDQATPASRAFYRLSLP